MKRVIWLLFFITGSAPGQQVSTFYHKTIRVPESLGMVSQYIDGIIIDDTILLDKSGHGFDIYILNSSKDFPGNKGIPEKSGVLIYQKPANFGFINDSTHFWFNSETHQPNLIPVTSLFPDVDYNHTTFCKHQPQILDENGIEISEGLISAIINYSSPLSGNNLLRACLYFDVPPVASSGVIWVDGDDGSDISGNGTYLKPYQTISKANISANNGDTVYCKTGNVTDGVPGSYYSMNKSVDFISVGNCIISGKNGSTAIYQIQVSSGISFTGFTFLSSGIIGSILNINSGAHNLSLSRCRFVNTTPGVRTIQGMGSGVNGLNIKNSVFIQNNAAICLYPRYSDVLIHTCFFNLSTSTQIGIAVDKGCDIQHCRFWRCNTGGWFCQCWWPDIKHCND